MNTILTATITEEEQQSFNSLAVGFTAKELAECLHDYEYPYSLDPGTLLQKIVDLGFFSVNLPAEYGGLGLSFQPLAGILGHISLIDAGVAGAVFANAAALEIVAAASAGADCGAVYDVLGQEGALPLAFQAYAAPGETSVPSCVRRDGAHLLTGAIDLVVSGGTAAHAVIPAKMDDGAYSYFLVNLGGPGIKKSAPVVTIGMQSCRPVDIELDGARGVLIGAEGRGRSLFEEMRGKMSYPACGIFLGIMKGSFRAAIEYCEQRYQGGRMIINWNDIRMKLAGMESIVRLAETCVCGLKSMFEAGSADAGSCAVSGALHVGHMSVDATSEGIQLLGGNGYMKDYGQEKRMRDAKQAQCLLGSPLIRKRGLIETIINEREGAGN